MIEVHVLPRVFDDHLRQLLLPKGSYQINLRQVLALYNCSSFIMQVHEFHMVGVLILSIQLLQNFLKWKKMFSLKYLIVFYIS